MGGCLVLEVSRVRVMTLPVPFSCNYQPGATLQQPVLLPGGYAGRGGQAGGYFCLLETVEMLLIIS